MKYNTIRLLSIILAGLLILCSGITYASSILQEEQILHNLHYSLPLGWQLSEYQEDGVDYHYHLSDPTGSIGKGAVLVGAHFDDYSNVTPLEFYLACTSDFYARTSDNPNCEYTTISDREAILMYSDGPIYEAGESSSATLVILDEGCAYWLSFLTESPSAKSIWSDYVTNVYLGDNSSIANTPQNDISAQFTTIKRGDKGEDVKQLQLRLITLGYLTGSADGDFGPKTENAVIAYQKAAGVPASGECDYATYVSLNDENAPAAPKATATPKPTEAPSSNSGSTAYIGNKNTKKFHETWCSSVDQMKESNKVSLSSREAAISKGYVPCKRCNP